MRVVIDTELIWFRIKFFWNHKILRKPVPAPDFNKMMEAIIMAGVGFAIAGEVSKVFAENKSPPENKLAGKSENSKEKETKQTDV